MPIFANAIPQVEPPMVGIHLLWNGPHPWVYSPTGWIIQRRDWNRRLRLDCLTLSPSELATLRARRELRIRFGALTDRAGECPAPLVAVGAGPAGGVILSAGTTRSRATVAAGVAASRATSAGTAASFAASTIGLPIGCEIITLELDLPQSYVRVFADAHGSFAVALRDGKVVAGGREVAGSGFHELAAEGIDTVVVYARALTGVSWCVRKGDDGEDGWDDVPVIARLQLPIRPLMPLANAAAELDEARSRLLPGETIEADEFAHLADLIRGLIEGDGAARPIDRTLLLKSDEEIDPEEMAALDPLRSVLPHPTWRRALGFAWFDRDPTLVPGAVYEYRLTAGFPAADLADAVYGFHTVPAETPLPSDFYLHDLRIRLPQASRVERFDPAVGGGKPVYTRHGVSLSPDRLPFWLGEEIDGWSAVIDLPGPSKSVILDLRGTHTLKFAAGAPWLPWPPGMQDVPAGEHVTLSFPAEIHQLRLSGKGFLCGIRIPAAPPPPDGIQPIHTVLPPVTLINTPRPGAPLSAGISNLQAPQPVASNDIPEALAPPKQQLGFEVRWRPAPIDGITSWPDALPPPPSAATLFQVEGQQIEGGPAWIPLIDGDNIISGHRDDSPPVIDSGPGVDLMKLYPEVRLPSAGSVDLTWPDVFDFPVEGEPMRRPPPAPGTHHRYRIRAVDAIGRPGDNWIETAAMRLEKWVPPPLPVGPDPTPAGDLARPAPTGVHVRVLVRGAEDLTADEQALLGSHQNAILIRWGWHAMQRAQDPFATEFRVYTTRRDPTGIAATIDTVTDLGNGSYDVTLELARPVAADASRGLRLDAGYPFEITAHGEGTSIGANLLARVPFAGGVYPIPRTGPVRIPVRLIPEATRPPAWGARVEIVAISASTAYESAPIFDALELTEVHPRDEMWIGVASADAQSYVPDALAPADARPGNESAIVPIHVEARYRGRPQIVEAPALDPVPVIVAPEPAPRPMEFRLDLTPILAGTGLAAGERVRIERVNDAQVFRAYRIEGDRILARVPEPVAPGDAEIEVTVPNSGDRAAIRAALAGPTLDGLEDRYLVFLAASHPYRARLYAPAVASPIVLPLITHTLPNEGARHVYRARRADAAGNVSVDGITLRGVVRVPSTRAVSTPLREPRQAGDPETRLRFRVDGASEVTHLLVFHQEAPAGAPGASDEDAPELVRVPSAPHLAPAERAKLRLASGAFLVASVIDLPGPPPDGPRLGVIADLPPAPGARVRVWACAMTQDGVVSPLAGPFALSFAPPPLAAPTLAATTTGAEVTLSWTWPTAEDASEVVVERSTDGVRFDRVSPRLNADVATAQVKAGSGPSFFRLRARRLDGRTAFSNVVGI